MRCAKCYSEFARNRRGEVVDRHDCRYVRAVNALVEEAYEEAVIAAETCMVAFGPHADEAAAHAKYLNQAFHDGMALRTHEAGLRR